MPHDYIKKEPTKTEKFMYELAMHQQQLENQTFSNSMTILAVALVLGADAAKSRQVFNHGRRENQSFWQKYQRGHRQAQGAGKETRCSGQRICPGKIINIISPIHWSMGDIGKQQ